MSNLRICRVCLRTDVKMYSCDKFYLKSFYEEIIAQKIDVTENLPQNFCFECAALLYKYHKFKEKCHYGLKILLKLAWSGPVTYSKTKQITSKTKLLKPFLQIPETSKNIRTYTVKSKDSFESKREIEFVAENNEDSDDLPLQAVTKREIEDPEDLDCSWDNDVINHIDNEQEMFLDKQNPINIFVDENKEAINIQAVELKDLISDVKPLKRKKFQRIPNSKIFDMSKWKKYHLNEDEAVKEFEARAEKEYYKTALFKCTDCLKGFSTENMFKRHIKNRHDKAIGDFECRFCKMRFRMACNLRKHLRSHYIRYECLECKMMMFESSAILHDEYHSGMTKTCEQCGEEFRHQSTYYTHLRTHRSAYVCALCGSSFVSQLGLRNHQKIKHVLDNVESASDDEPVNTYCDRCDITFETRRAYEEHLFHSVMHVDSMEDEDASEDCKKILGKKLKKGICQKLRLNKDGSEIMSKIRMNKKRNRRTRKKPTTCHQCGKSFDTQAACMSHHTREHPGTSFFPAEERHVCEICGASLAPGSVAMHENIHTRKKLFPCEVCGKEFHSAVGLKRHAVTHTGEKPFACTMCDKRFTQSNSMKLHLKTYHLKQPYPKRNRNRKKTKDDILELREEISKTSSEHSATEEQRGDGVMIRLPDDNMHYLTLN